MPAALREPVVAAELGLAGAALLVGRLGGQRRDLDGPALLVEGDHRQVGGGHVHVSRLRMFSDVTRTPTSIELRQAAFTLACTVRSCPMCTGLQERHPVHRGRDHAQPE